MTSMDRLKGVFAPVVTPEQDAIRFGWSKTGYRPFAGRLPWPWHQRE